MAKSDSLTFLLPTRPRGLSSEASNRADRECLLATAQTIIRGHAFHVFLRADLDEHELSISLYHEVLEASTVAADQPPSKVMDFNEGHFEEAAQKAHQRWGIASPVTLNQFLAEFGF